MTKTPVEIDGWVNREGSRFYYFRYGNIEVCYDVEHDDIEIEVDNEGCYSYLSIPLSTLLKIVEWYKQENEKDLETERDLQP